MSSNDSSHGNRTGTNITDFGMGDFMKQQRILFGHMLRLLNALGIAIVVISILGLAVNMTITVAFIRSKRLRRLYDKMLACLAVFSVFTLLHTPLYAVYLFKPSLQSTEKYLCVLVTSLHKGNVRMTTLLNFGLSLERFICIKYPFSYQKIGIKHIAGFIGVCACITVATWTLPVIVMGLKNWEVYHACMNFVPRELSICVDVLAIGLACLGLIFHLFVFRVAARHSQTIFKQQQGLGNLRQQNSHLKSERHQTTTILLVLIAAGITQIPIHIYNVYERYMTGTMTPTAILIKQLLAILWQCNHMFGPAIYISRNTPFKTAIWRLFRQSQRVSPADIVEIQGPPPIRTQARSNPDRDVESEGPPPIRTQNRSNPDMDVGPEGPRDRRGMAVIQNIT